MEEIKVSGVGGGSNYSGEGQVKDSNHSATDTPKYMGCTEQ